MKSPATPADEESRQAALDDLRIVDSPAEERFDRITRLATRALDVPIALVSLVDRDRQWFKSSQGLEARETPRNVSFCGHAILEPQPFVVPDASADARFADNPLVTGEPGIRFYAGMPLSAPGGKQVGTLCVIDRVPRELSREDTETLTDLAALVEQELETTRLTAVELELRSELAQAQLKAAIDPLTRLWNRESILEIGRRELERAKRSGRPIGVAMVDLDDFKSINDTFGHLAGDAVLEQAASRLRAGVRPYDAVGRYGGEEFLFVLAETDADTTLAVSERVRRLMSQTVMDLSEVEKTLTVTASIGAAHFEGSEPPELERLIAVADESLYRAKASGKNRVVVAPA